METEFDVQRDHVRLLQRIGALLEPGGLILFSSNFQRFKLDTAALPAFEVQDISRATLPEDYKRNPKIHVAYLLTQRQAGSG